MNRDSNTFVVVLILALSVALAGVGIALLMSTNGPTAAASPQQPGWFGNSRAAVERERRLAEDLARKAAADAAKIEQERRKTEQAAKEKQKQDVAKAKPDRPAEETKPEAKKESKKEDAKPKPAPARTEEEEKAAEQFRDSTIAREAVARESRRKNLLANRSIPFGRFNPVMCAEKSAAEFEESFFEDEPAASTSIAFVDVSTADGSLIAHFTQEVEKGPEAAQKAAADVVIRAWRQSKFTTKLGFSRTVEFRGSDKVLFTNEG